MFKPPDNSTSASGPRKTGAGPREKDRVVAFQRRAEPGSDGWLERRDGVGVLGYGIVIPYPG